MKFITGTMAALLISVFSLNANAVVINFVELTEGSGQLGESYWDTLSVAGAYGLEITGHATNDDDPDQFAYLDWNHAGLGVCKDGTGGSGAHSGSGSNRCDPSSDDNVTVGEYLQFSFDTAVVVNNLWFNNSHDGGFDSADKVTIDGVGYDVTTGYAGDGNGIGSFSLSAGQILEIAYNNEEFYVSAMEVSAVPVPAAIWLFGTALIGLVGFGKRKVGVSA